MKNRWSTVIDDYS